MVRLSQLHPAFYHLRIQQKRIGRSLEDKLKNHSFAHQKSLDSLLYRCTKHQSLLRRKLGSSDPQLQHNEVINLAIAHQTIDGILIRPGETFSFWHQVGESTAKRGYVEGMQLSKGEVESGIGGGLCQLANLLYWMTLHTPLQVVERHHHSFDPFPDEHRVLPFGSGASVFYNYVDLRFYNPTNQAFQFRVWLTDDHLQGAVFTDREWAYSYHIQEKNHQFLKQDQKNYRSNEIWRSAIDKRTGNLVTQELMIKNFSEVKYSLDDITQKH